MKTILDGTSRRVGSIFAEIDTNFIEVCNSLLKIAFPECTLTGLAESEPDLPNLYDSYLVTGDATIWGIVAEKNDFIYWNGAAWELLPFKITEINEAIQFLYFDADKIAVSPIAGLQALHVQSALAEITASLVSAGIIIPSTGSGSGIVSA